jgi:pyruvate dehydrogenase E2 component (dihydrolipoamide acetyltransferase)
MSTPVVMPQMGESIAEGTIVRWIKKVGDSVDRDEPLFEISTDKVDAEIPSPAAGTLLEIKVKEGETVSVNSVVATIGAMGERGAASEPGAAASGTAGASVAAGAAATVKDVAETPPPSGKTVPPKAQADGSSAQTSSTAAAVPPASRTATAPSATAAPKPAVAAPPEPPPAAQDDDRKQRSSPLVRRIAEEHGVDIRQITGSGTGGRVTKTDILGFIESGASASARAESQASYGETSPERPEIESREGGAAAPYTEAVAPGREGRTAARGAGDRVEPMSIMRKKIAEHMIVSKRTSAHVYSVFEVNYHRVDQIRRARKGDYEQKGVKLTYTSFIAKVATDCLRHHPVINASIDGDTVVYKQDINLGIAVALENGLIVAVVKRADELNLLGLSRAIADVADRARARKLSPDEVHGGTFTITNPGNFGAQFGLPIINQPQVAILGVGAIEKRAVVIDDMIGIRLMGYLTLGYDHRLVDGAVADQFMADVKKGIENFEPAQV